MMMNNQIGDYEARRSGIPAHPRRDALLASVVTGGVIGALIGAFSLAGWMAVAIGLLLGAALGAGVAQYMNARWRRER
jgi:hypothetical protein